MATYTIKIVNQSGGSKSYVAFLQPPAVAPPGQGAPGFANAWVTFPDLANGDFDAVTYTPPAIDHGAAAGGAAEIPLTDAGGDALLQSTFTSFDGPVFVDATPITKFYVAGGTFTPGQIIDTTISSPLATIDFTGLPQTTATVTEEPDGGWTVTYS